MSSPSSRYGRTVYLPDLDGSHATPLQRIRLCADPSGSRYNEDWLQALLFRTPEVLPIGEIEPAFAPAVPLCREMPTPAGPIDLAYMNEQGMLTLVECKLWRNPEARRDAVSQILDYAKEVGRWSYEDLNAAVGRATRRTDNSLFDIVSIHGSETDEATFVDDVSRNLARGRFLLIVVGDGIRESVELIADYLQQYAGLHFTFALVELAIFDMPEGSPGGVIVEPRVLARTLEIERAVVRLVGDGMTIDAASEDPTSDPARGGRRRRKITEEEFYKQLAEVDPSLPNQLRKFFADCEEVGLTVTVARASLILNWFDEDGQKVNFGTFFPAGNFQTNYHVNDTFERGDEHIGVRYLEDLAGLIPRASVKKDGNYWTWRVVVDGRLPMIADGLKRSDDWLKIIERSTEALDQLKVD